MENNKKIELNFATISNNIAVPEIVDKKTSKKYISWGNDNKFPNYLFDAYLKCSDLQAIVNQLADYICGEGITANFNYLSDDDEYISEVIKKCVFDYILFGGFAVEGIRSREKQIVRLNYLNVMNVRVNEDLDTAFLSNKWGSWSGNNIVELPLYDKKEQQDHFVFYYRGKVTRNINPVPIYSGALKSIEILNNIRDFHLNNLNNGFSSAAIINLNDGNIKTRELKEIKERIEDKFCGTKNAGKFILLNGGDKEHEATIVKLDANNFGEQYYALQDSSKEDLFVAFRMNPMLVGVNVETGFTKEEFENAYALYYATVVKPIQNEIKDCFYKLGVTINIEPFKINWSE